MSKGPSPALIRPLRADDRAEWNVLWHDYLAFYETTLSDDIYETCFARLLGDDPQDYCGLVAELDGQLVGLAHYLFHRHGWRVENVCYLQDLFVAPAARGTHLGRALIEAVYAEADRHGIQNVYWTTQENNTAGRRLYDRVGQLTDFIKYQRPA